MNFENLSVSLEDLPKVAALNFTQLDPRYRTVSYISTTLFFSFLFIVANIIVFANGGGLKWWVGAVYLVWLVWFGLGMWTVQKRYDLTGYALRQRDIIYKTGLLGRSVTTIPFNRIQHCEITEGPIQKSFKLASLKVYTAGGSGSDLSIPGLHRDDAAMIKEYLTGKIQSSDEEE